MVLRDISVRKQTESFPQECEERYLAAITTESPNPVLECDAGGFLVYVNPAARAVLNTLSLDLYDFLPPNHIEIVHACLQEGHPTLDIEVHVRNRIFSWCYQPSALVGTVHLYATDVTDRKRAEEHLQKNAIEDALTGLPNRALLMDRLERSVDMLQRHGDYIFAVLLLDLDRFKVINESMGHAQGDRVLVEVTHRLRSCVKQSDSIARTGGDEFVILLEDISSPTDASRVAERIQEELSRPFRVNDQDVYVSASMGIIVATDVVDDPDNLLRDAETAMYRSKSEGKERYTVFDRTMHEETTGLVRLEADLRAALERDELFVVYQPIVSVSSLRIIGFEALVRWRHPLQGVLSPARFLPLAEETGLILPIDDRVTREACRQNRAWQDAGYGVLTTSVNITARNFRSDDLFERLGLILTQTGLAPRFLKVEVTENVAAKDAELAIQVLGRLRRMGIQVMIDDFGTGYSSLSYLKRLPIDVLKIDRSFIQDTSTDPTSSAMVTTIILMAHALGLEVVAEGVENEDQLELLRRHNCDYAQGFLFSRPVPPEDFAELLRSGTGLRDLAT
jgi:diguanylate cyclase (GGDEF)-like protein